MRANGRLALAASGCYEDAECERPLIHRAAAFVSTEGLLRVAMHSFALRPLCLVFNYAKPGASLPLTLEAKATHSLATTWAEPSCVRRPPTVASLRHRFVTPRR